MSTATSHPSQNVDSSSTPPAGLSRYRAAANPFARLVAQRRAALMASVKDEDIKEIGHVLVDMAKDGDLPAAKLLFAYLLGKPGEAVAPDRLDIDEWQIFKETAPMAAEMPHLAQTPSSHFPRDIVRMMRPANAADLARQMHQFVHQPTAPAEAAPSPDGDHGKKPCTPPSPNGVSDVPAGLDSEAWLASLNLAQTLPNDDSAR